MSTSLGLFSRHGLVCLGSCLAISCGIAPNGVIKPTNTGASVQNFVQPPYVWPKQVAEGTSDYHSKSFLSRESFATPLATPSLTSITKDHPILSMVIVVRERWCLSALLFWMDIHQKTFAIATPTVTTHLP